MQIESQWDIFGKITLIETSFLLINSIQPTKSLLQIIVDCDKVLGGGGRVWSLQFWSSSSKASCANIAATADFDRWFSLSLCIKGEANSGDLLNILTPSSESSSGSSLLPTNSDPGARLPRNSDPGTRFATGRKLDGLPHRLPRNSEPGALFKKK